MLDSFLLLLNKFLMFGEVIIFFAFAAGGVSYYSMKKDDMAEEAKVHLSVLITSGVVISYHYLGSLYVNEFMGMAGKLDKVALRKIFYTVMIQNEITALLTLFGLHKLLGCPFAKVTRYIMFMSLGILVLQALGYFERVVLGTYYGEYIYRFGITLIDIITPTLLSLYLFLQCLSYFNRKRNYVKQ